MVIDIIGAPGSGKTTVCNRIKNSLRRRSIPYIDMTGRKNTPFQIKVFIRLCMIWIYLSPMYRSIYNEIEVKLAQYPKESNKYFYSNLGSIMRDVVRHVFAHKLFEKNNIYLLNDEGVLHKMLPISIQHGVPVNVLVEIYKSFNMDLKLILVDSDIEQVFTNNIRRNRHDCDYDNMNEVELRNYLAAYYDVLNQVLQDENYTIVNIKDESIII